jgi:superfamily I DNA/RNA helicase
MNETWWVRPEQLDENQRAAIEVPSTGRYLIVGPPGSGKTNLLMLRAKYMIGAGFPNIIALVFTRTLEEFMASCPPQYRIPRDKLRTCQRWEMELICQLGGTPSSDDDFQRSRRENCRILGELIRRESLRNMYDAILLDEAQDYSEDEVRLFLSLSANLFAVGDNYQQIYGHNDAMSVLGRECQVHTLLHHYRNGLAICRLADAIGSAWGDYRPLTPTSQYDEEISPSRVHRPAPMTIDAQAAEIIESVRLQLKAYPNELIGVLCPRRSELASVERAFAASDLAPLVTSQLADDGHLSFTENTRICVCTLHSAKGLEFRATHLAGCEYVKNFRDRQRKMAYTGVTRGKTALTIYNENGLPQFFEGALAATAPRPQPPSVEDLFGAT